MTPSTIFHQCRDWLLQPGRQRDCKICRGGQLRPRRKYIPPKPLYTYEEALAQIDICAGCGDGIAREHPYHHCEKCLPAWLERIAKINAAQERLEGSGDVG